ncbi:MAG TPA: SCO family protein, partial [Chthoniobacterales bacterium]|nr:SCO family protein [Chthoniobacterales bacterium]
MRKTTVLKITLALCFAVASLGCQPGAKSDVNAQHYETRGVVRGISPDRTTLEIQHENIPDFMPSMTMPFSARDQKETANFKIGDAISFRMTVTKKDFWIDRVKKIPREDVDVRDPKPNPTISEPQSSRLREGDAMPAFSLTNQNEKAITPETFRGRPLFLTFIFTRCPMPNFCPRMTNNFSELQNAIKASNGVLAETRLLSITLDPAFDTPQILKEYGEHQNADATVWTFATGDPKEIDALTHAFSVYVQTEGGTISHGLATVLVGPDGKIVKIWRGNGWKPDEIIS